MMAAKPLTSKAIAFTEKKMDMALDDIIKISKSNTTKGQKQRVSNRSQTFVKNAAQEKYAKVWKYMDSRSSIRQGDLVRRRSNFLAKQFPLATEASRKAAVAPIRNRPFNQSRGFATNTLRVWAPVQKKASNGSFDVKGQREGRSSGVMYPPLSSQKLQLNGFSHRKYEPKPHPQVNAGPRQKPQTLDSRFANLKEQRMRAFSPQSNSGRRNGGGGGRQRQQWGRGRFGN